VRRGDIIVQAIESDQFVTGRRMVNDALQIG